MKRWKEKLEAMAAAVSFAEAGDWETARELLATGLKIGSATVVKSGPTRPIVPGLESIGREWICNPICTKQGMRRSQPC